MLAAQISSFSTRTNKGSGEKEVHTFRPKKPVISS
jgi:hypothetical protein